jgi:hypothetical protein
MKKRRRGVWAARRGSVDHAEYSDFADLSQGSLSNGSIEVSVHAAAKGTVGEEAVGRLDLGQ